MNPNVLAYINAALQLVPVLVQTGANVVAYIEKLKADLDGFAASGGEPTAAQWQTQNTAMMAALTGLMAQKPQG